jgi:hypothetical protein
MQQNGTPYFVFNSKLRKTQDKHEGYLDPEHLLVVFIHRNRHNGDFWNTEIRNHFYYTVTDANNNGEVEYDDYPSIVRDYPFLKGLQKIFKPINLSKKEKDILHLHQESSSLFTGVNNKYEKLTKSLTTISGGFRDSCDNYLPFFHSPEDLTNTFNKPIFDLFRQGYNKSYTAFFRGNNGRDKKLVGLTTHQKCEEMIKQEIGKYTKEYNNLKDNPHWSNQSDTIEMTRYMMDEKNYGIEECEWPPLYVYYLKEIYALSVKIMHKKWSIEKTQ